MAEETPLEPIPPEPITAETVPADAAPTEPVAAVTPPASAGAPPMAPPPGAWPTPTEPPRGSSSTVAVPKWLLLVAGALVIALIGFGIGYAVAPDDGGDSRAFGPSSRFVPGPFTNNGGEPGNGNGNGNNGNGNNGNSNNGNGNGDGSNDQPTIPAPNQSGAFLGVATTASTNPKGVRIRQLVPGSPAAGAGLKVDDVITKVGDEAVSSPDQLGSLISGHDAGDEVTITYVRNGDTNTARVTLVSRPSTGQSIPTQPQPRL